MAKRKLPGHHDSSKRDYKGEYAQYHGKPEQKKRRAARTRQRRKADKEGRVSKGDGKELHHKDGNPLNGSSDNVQVLSEKKNRSLSAPQNLKKGKKPKSLRELRDMAVGKYKSRRKK